MAAKLIQDVKPVATVPAPRPLAQAKHQVAERLRESSSAVPGRPRPLPHLAPYRPVGRQQAPVPRSALTKPPVHAPTPPSAVSKPQPKSHPVPRQRNRPSWRHRLIEVLQYIGVSAAALIAANNTTLGQWMVLAYAVYAIVRGLRSQISFGAALFLLVAIPVFQLLGQDGVAQNVAIYVYELLVIGTVQAIIELYKSRHKSKPLA